MKHNYLKHLFTALLLLCTTVATAHDFEVGGIYYNILSPEDKTVEVTCKGSSYSHYSNEYSGSVVIPESVIYDGITYRVTSIEHYAFSYCSELTSVVIGNSVTIIEHNAFNGCTGLRSIVIGNSVTSIGDQTFNNCKKLTEVKIPNSVISIGNSAFSYCSGLKSVEIGNSITSIGDGAFYGCTSFTSVVIPNSVIEIGVNAFGNCSGLKSVEIGNSVTSIGDGAFYGCTSLTSVVIPNSVISIEYYAFSDCTGLKKIELNCANIGNWFSRNTSIEEVVIGDSVTSIGSSAFRGCTGLTSITSLIPAEDLFSINSSVFNDVDKDICTLYVPYGAKERYAATAGWKDFKNIVEIPGVAITINQYGCATYCSEYALDFSNIEGLKAYAATGYNKVTQVVTLTRLQTAEAGVGLFLKGEPGEYVVPVIEYSNDYSLNMLVGTLEQTTVNSTDGAMSNYKFTIAEGDAAPMFYPFEDNTTFSAGKAYLQIPTAWLPATAQKSLSVRFDDGETTDIDEMKEQRAESKGVYYDLSGRVVENPSSGIYIINGKKVVVK